MYVSVSAQIFIQLFVDVHGILYAPCIIHIYRVKLSSDSDKLLKFSNVAER